jgi:hypothetical protein
LSSNAFIFLGGLGNLTVNACTLSQSSRINQTSTSDRNYQITRVTGSEVAQISLTGTGVGIADAITDTNITSRAIVSLGATGAVANSVLYSDIKGISGSVSIVGTSSAQTVQRLTVMNGQFNVTNCTAASTHDFNSVATGSSVSVSGLTVVKNLVQCSADTGGTINVSGTVAGQLTYLRASDAGSINVSGTCGTVTRASAEGGGTINFTGGAAHNQVSKKNVGSFTTNNFNQDNVLCWTTAPVTATAANSNRATYLGLSSLVPIV